MCCFSRGVQAKMVPGSKYLSHLRINFLKICILYLLGSQAEDSWWKDREGVPLVAAFGCPLLPSCHPRLASQLNMGSGGPPTSGGSLLSGHLVFLAPPCVFVPLIPSSLSEHLPTTYSVYLILPPVTFGVHSHLCSQAAVWLPFILTLDLSNAFH